jgi:hypothetical protein
MSRAVLSVVVTTIFATCVTESTAQVPAPNDAARGMVGAWEISNAARDKTCPVTFSTDAGEGGFRLELDPGCRTAFPSLKDVAAWATGPGDTVRLFDSKGAVVLDFSEVESHMYEAERKGEGLFFMRTQAAIRAATISPEQLFGDWTMLQCLRGRGKLQGCHQGRLRRIDHGFCAFHVAPGEQRAVVLRPCRHLALCGKRCDDLGADSAQHRSAAPDAAVTGHASWAAVVVGAAD